METRLFNNFTPFLFLLVFSTFTFCEKNINDLEVDSNGYIIFCLCMGRIGNQVEHFLGGMDFAKRMNRTLVLPSFRMYAGANRNVPFDEWFSLEAMQKYHKVILADEFMLHIAPIIWPIEKRIAFCYSDPRKGKTDCRMKEGDPFGPFWDGLNVDFVSEVNFHSLNNPEQWNTIYPPAEYPVIALKGAPAPFPMLPSLWHLQKHLVFSDYIMRQANKYIEENFPYKSFIGIHLRNGADWEKACKLGVGSHSFMASPQCLEDSNDTISSNMCLPSKPEVLRRTTEAVMKEQIQTIFVATDRNPMISELSTHLQHKNVRIFHADPELPLVDWAILIRSDLFIGNCVSSFSSFVKRYRDVLKKPTVFWGREWS